MKIYVGGALFNEAEIDFTKKVANKIRKELGKDVDIYVPAENKNLNEVRYGYGFDPTIIFNEDNTYLKEADILIAILDGRVPDLGLLVELGYFASLLDNGKKKGLILGLQTNTLLKELTEENKLDLLKMTNQAFMHQNLYVHGAIKSFGDIYVSSDAVVDEVIKYVRGNSNEK